MQIRVWFIFVLIVLGQHTSWSQEQSSSGVLSEPISSDEGDFAHVDWRGELQVHRFQVASLGESGQSFEPSLVFYDPRLFDVRVKTPLISGEVWGERVYEVGNISISADLRLGDMGDSSALDFWLTSQFKAAQSGAIPSHFDTYRLGGRLRGRKGNLESTMESAYQWRGHESDSRLDVGDLVDVKYTLGIDFSRRWHLGAGLQWYFVRPTYLGNWKLTDDLVWLGLLPGLQFKVGGGVEFYVGARIPLLLTQTVAATEMAFNDIDLPSGGSPTVHFGVGAAF